MDRPDENTPLEELHRQRKGFFPGSQPYEDASFELQRRQIESLKKPHWTVRPNFWFTVIAAIAATAACFIAWFAWQRPITPPALVTASLPQPTAAEVFELRSRCSTLGEKLLEKNVVGSNFRQSQVSHYDPKANRCYVEITVQSGDLTKKPTYLHRALYDGQTGKMLADALIENGEKSGVVFASGILGFEEASAYIDKKMKED